MICVLVNKLNFHNGFQKAIEQCGADIKELQQNKAIIWRLVNKKVIPTFQTSSAKNAFIWGSFLLLVAVAAAI